MNPCKLICRCHDLHIFILVSLLLQLTLQHRLRQQVRSANHILRQESNVFNLSISFLFSDTSFFNFHKPSLTAPRLKGPLPLSCVITEKSTSCIVRMRDKC
ncbi:hypothetical protein AAHE18_20G126900 [Arachis hypogaea]